ncbi:hypothetical protein [Methylococcus mesophilus]|uniref:hypothetical protein n=1 Tax=Methylococcus mesophilus TaxID=2993564 RepID=UPI00224AD066|nr:hypothetical protein [Methylococcus mesophilus]UZR27460.1 hypothetical protein OOT43_12020 [Methylococcus mesophilus]
MGREKLPETEMPNLPALPEEQLIANHNRAVLDAAETDRQYGDILPYQLDRVTQEIRFLLNQSAEAMLEAGRRLIQIKDREPRGEFMDAVQKIGIDQFVASKLIRAARKFSNLRSNANLMALGKTKLIELAVLDEDEIDELANDQEVRGLVTCSPI